MPGHPIPLASAPEVKGPYSPAVMADGLVAFAGQIALDPGTGQLIDAPADRQLELVVATLFQMAAELGAGPSDFIMLTVYLTDIGDFADVNRAYAQAFGGHRPARAVVGVAGLPLGAKVEVQAWLSMPSPSSENREIRRDEG